MAKFHLSLITPLGKVFDNDIESLKAPGVLGSFGVLTRHAPFLSALQKGVLKLTSDEGEKFFAIDSGILEVDNKNTVLVLADHALLANNQEEALNKLKEIS